MRFRLSSFAIFWIPTALVLFALVVTHPVYGQKKDDRKDDRKEDKKEKGLSSIRAELQPQVDELAREFLKRKYDDDFLQGYINELGQTLVPKETPSGILFSFRVILDPVPNAIALPDGRIFIHSGLLTFVENEAQLAAILGHEIGHVTENHAAEAIKEAGSWKRTLTAAVAGGIAGALTKDREVAQAAAQSVTVGLASHYNKKQEDEADLVGCNLALSNRYDPSQAIGFFQKLTSTFGEQNRLTNFLVGTHSLNVDRANNIRKLLDGDLRTEYNKLKGEGQLTVGSGQLRLHSSKMIRDTAWVLAELFDRYDLGKERLESILDVRGRDPKTLWYLGRIYRLIARTDEQKNKALELLQRAAEVDERNLYPEINRDLGLMLASRTANLTAAVESLKKYVVVYTQKRFTHPPDLEEIYDYLLLFGDSKWTAPKPETQFIKTQEVVKAEPAVAGDEQRTAGQAVQPQPTGTEMKKDKTKPGKSTGKTKPPI